MSSEKLSKNELRQLQTIKKLRAKAGEDEKGTAELRKRVDRAEKAELDLKQRLRKSDASEKQSSQEKPSSRKSSKAAVETVAQAQKQPEPVADPELDEWYEHQKSLQTFIQGLVQPDDAQTLQYIKDAQERLNAMGKISHGLIQGSQRRSWRG